jgi:galactonate dehydratase
VPTYANINRGIAERTPEGFAANARAALRDGFTAIKIAPFDRVELYGDERKTVDYALIGAGLARIGAVRDAIGPDVDLMVDCHWRLTRTVAEAVIRATESLRLHWLECPVPETPEMLDTLCALRSMANSRGVLLAGCEEMSLIAGFMPFLEVGAYDVMMPDVKYVGGMRQMLEVADMLASYGVAFSPHNPSGPVCHAASLQLCAATEHLQRLEMQYNETSLFDLIVRPAVAKAVSGAIEVSRMPGLGVALDPTQVEALREDVAGQSVVSLDVKRVSGAS